MGGKFVSRKELKSLAKQQLKERWGKAVLVTLLFMVITIALQLIYTLGIVPTENVILSVIGYIALIVILCVLSFGYARYALNFTDNEKTPKAGDLIALAPVTLKIIGLNILVGLIVLVGTILLIIPGIIAGLALY